MFGHRKETAADLAPGSVNSKTAGINSRQDVKQTPVNEALRAN